MPISTDGPSTTTVPKVVQNPIQNLYKIKQCVWCRGKEGDNKTINTKDKQRIPPQLFPLREAPGQGGIIIIQVLFIIQDLVGIKDRLESSSDDPGKINQE